MFQASGLVKTVQMTRKAPVLTDGILEECYDGIDKYICVTDISDYKKN